MMKKKYIFIVLLLVFSAILIYNYVYQEHRDIAHEVSEYKVSPYFIFHEFQDELHNSEDKYLDKTISVRGVITNLNETDLTLGKKVFCLLKIPNSSIKLNDSITIKGRCIGYDDLLEVVKLDQCVVTD